MLLRDCRLEAPPPSKYPGHSRAAKRYWFPVYMPATKGCTQKRPYNLSPLSIERPRADSYTGLEFPAFLMIVRIVSWLTPKRQPATADS